MIQQTDIQSSVYQALLEDCHSDHFSTADITAQLIAAEDISQGSVITRENCVLAGKPFVEEVFQQLGNHVTLQWYYEDGQSVKAGETLFDISGNTRCILTGERTALNFLQTLSATATVTATYMRHLRGSSTQLLDTRKTLPGLRMAQKYAVTCGGGTNHRFGLYDAFLIKENHIHGCGSISAAVAAARQIDSNKKVEVEVENLQELQQALQAGADIIMLDNFSLTDVQQAVTLNAGQAKLEVSGNIDEQRLDELVRCGVDYISSGALTKHIQAIDLSLRLR